jgi:GT2 family glycosyltransferase
MDSPVKRQIPVSAVIPTANRAESLRRTLQSIAAQSCQPAEIIITDASGNEETKKVCSLAFDGLTAVIRYKKAMQKGAAAQRNEGVGMAVHPAILFMDDDIILEPGCIERLWNCLQSDQETGGVNAMIINQRYHKPGRLTAFMYRLMNGKRQDSYAGKCIGPAWNVLPEDNEALPEWNRVEWLNTTCTLYRAVALPKPVFHDHFKGYSLMEDLALSLEVGKKWKLYNVRNAHIFHDSQQGEHKNNVAAVAKMELVNRHYIMVNVLGRSGFSNHLKLLVFELFGIVAGLNSKNGWKNLLPVIGGKLKAIGSILSGKKHEQ